MRALVLIALLFGFGSVAFAQTEEVCQQLPAEQASQLWNDNIDYVVVDPTSLIESLDLEGECSSAETGETFACRLHCSREIRHGGPTDPACQLCYAGAETDAGNPDETPEETSPEETPDAE